MLCIFQVKKDKVIWHVFKELVVIVQKKDQKIVLIQGIGAGFLWSKLMEGVRADESTEAIIRLYKLGIVDRSEFNADTCPELKESNTKNITVRDFDLDILAQNSHYERVKWIIA